MDDLDFSSDQLLEQAKGNVSAVWHASARWARDQPGGVDAWASFVGRAFAPGWDELGDASAIEVARVAALNYATTADLRPIDLSGDARQAVLTLSGPEQGWLDEFGTTVAEIDRSNELVFAAIAERRGMTAAVERQDDEVRLTIARRS
jgi:hypothetical protein